MKRKLKATPRFIMLLTLICLIFAGAVILSQQAKLNEVLANTAESVQENTAEDENTQLNFDVL